MTRGEARSRSLLHICNGHATSVPLAAAGVPGRFGLFVDVLMEGPCPPLWDEEWRALRLNVLLGPDGLRDPGAPRPEAELWDRDVARALSADEGLDEVVLWYEHDLYDQLLLIRLLALIARHVGARPSISLVSIGEHPEVPDFKGLGQLTPDQLASLFVTRASVDEATIALGGDAWSAYTDPDPQKLEAFVARDLSALPFLARSLRRHLGEYPGIDDGLSRTERNLLNIVSEGVGDPVRAWAQLQKSEDCHFIPDSSYLRVLRRLTSRPAPLLTVEGELRLPFARGQGTLSLTPLAEEVLGGGVDWLALAGVTDRWLGGVHLEDPQSAWRWDAVLGRLRRRQQLT